MTIHDKLTTDHDTIRSWIEIRNGKPAIAPVTMPISTASESLLRIVFPHTVTEYPVTEVSWKQFFDTFERNQLTFLYRDRTDSGELSYFYNFVGI